MSFSNGLGELGLGEMGGHRERYVRVATAWLAAGWAAAVQYAECR